MQEQEVIDKMRDLRKQLMLQELGLNIYTGKIKYEPELVIAPEENQYLGLMEKDIFIVEKYLKTEDKEKLPIKILEIYNKEGEKIGHTTPEGELILNNEYIETMKQRYGQFYEKIGIEERKLYVHEIQKEIEDDFEFDIDKYIVSTSKELEKNQKEKIIEKGKKDKTIKIEDLSLLEQDLEITEDAIEYSVDILDELFYKEILPEAKQYDGRAKICKLKDGDIAVVGLKNGKYERITKVGELQESSSKKINLGQDGEDIKKENMYYELSIKGREDYKIAYKQGQYGLPEFQIARDAKIDGQHITMDLHTRVTYPAEESTRSIIDKRKNYDIKDEAENYQQRKNQGDKKIQTDEITQEEPIKEQFRKEQEPERERTLHDRGNRYYQ